MEILVYVLIGLAVLVVGQFVALWVGARVAPRPDNVNNGSLAPCPPSPNCVCTEDTDEQHSIAAIPYQVETPVARDTLLTLLRGTPKVDVITADETYIYAEARSPMMSFVDDMEFVIDAEQKVIRFRSAARLGRGDLGKNRARMETLREQFNEVQHTVAISRSDDNLTA
jgi:uncharacterized protein (DUF1499 family)